MVASNVSMDAFRPFVDNKWNGMRSKTSLANEEMSEASISSLLYYEDAPLWNTVHGEMQPHNLKVSMETETTTNDVLQWEHGGL